MSMVISQGKDDDDSIK